ncbi:hypothetical protein BZL30_9181 [Mycobacterium kansasii]|uniref:Uncharacterized protein n=1 Tax=Mycobacterium kansasii TaxID=1768 RepID=A0A1V3WBA7_MYCKA|nr:hypothetical protein BZL30_9181 [Mycobacterium kansasii]
MRRFLIVGCGGSGGATLAYMMDQLRSELHAAGIESLLPGWQFVVIDVPSGAEDGPEGLSNVPAQGGTYIGCARRQQLRDPGRGAFAAPGRQCCAGYHRHLGAAPPEEVTNPISTGAGQYRAIGRMIVLSKAARSGLGCKPPGISYSRGDHFCDVDGAGPGHRSIRPASAAAGARGVVDGGAPARRWPWMCAGC